MTDTHRDNDLTAARGALMGLMRSPGMPTNAEAEDAK